MQTTRCGDEHQDTSGSDVCVHSCISKVIKGHGFRLKTGPTGPYGTRPAGYSEIRVCAPGNWAQQPRRGCLHTFQKCSCILCVGRAGLCGSGELQGHTGGTFLVVDQCC